MSDLTSIEKRKLERVLGMANGYVLSFSNRTFREFFVDSFGIDIYDPKYDYASGSKANRMRAFWDRESNYLVGEVLELLFSEWSEFRSPGDPEQPPPTCWPIVRRLKESASVPDIGAVQANRPEQSFEQLAKSIRKAIDRNEPQLGLDRLHTFLIKYLRALCHKHDIIADRDKPLHSLLGEYIKALRHDGIIESAMTERILKTSISVMEAFNHVRNDKSFAHDNQVLGYDESLLIFSHVTSTIRFIESVENRNDEVGSHQLQELDDMPF